MKQQPTPSKAYSSLRYYSQPTREQIAPMPPGDDDVIRKADLHKTRGRDEWIVAQLQRLAECFAELPGLGNVIVQHWASGKGGCRSRHAAALDLTDIPAVLGPQIEKVREKV